MNQKKAAAGLFAASLAVAMAPMPAAQAPMHFTTDQGVLITVDPPAPNRQPLFVSLPVSGEQTKAPAPHGEQGSSAGR